MPRLDFQVKIYRQVFNWILMDTAHKQHEWLKHEIVDF